MGRKKTRHEFDEAVEGHLLDIVVNREYRVAQQNQSGDMSDFEACLDMFDAERSEKDYDWMSDIFIPEFPTHMLTQSSIDVSQYFATRDFVETYIQDPSEEALKAADATEELINRTLNQKEIKHYQKFIRAKNINHLIGHVDLNCWWEQELKDGSIIRDHFNYEILDPRNVFTSNEYAYSLQEKEWITIRMERTLEKLKQEADRNSYFNLYLLEELSAPQDTETKKETRDAHEPTTTYDNKISKKFDVLKRFGLFWIDADGKPGIDKNGDIKPDAELKEVIITTVLSGGNKILIGFNETPYVDANNVPYKPLIRGLCYIHPVKDAGVGDGKYAKELQVAINDTFNMSNDRVRLATMPTFKVNKQATEDTDTLYFEPGHGMELNDPKDIEEFKIQDNIQGAMVQLGLLTNKMQQQTAIFPTTMGDVPGESSTTATAIVGGAQHTQKRTNYKSLTFEYTCLTELYWMIQQMTWQFAYPETGEKLMGDKVYDFNPTLDYYFKPLSQSIETEESKQAKLKILNTMLGYVVQIQNPDLINLILSQMFLLMGDEFAKFSYALFNPQEPMQPVEGQEQVAGQGMPVSNQYQLTQGNTEQMARGRFEGMM